MLSRHPNLCSNLITNTDFVWSQCVLKSMRRFDLKYVPTPKQEIPPKPRTSHPILLPSHSISYMLLRNHRQKHSLPLIPVTRLCIPTPPSNHTTPSSNPSYRNIVHLYMLRRCNIGRQFRWTI